MCIVIERSTQGNPNIKQSPMSDTTFNKEGKTKSDFIIQDIIEEIKAVNVMCDLHSTNPSDFMLKQYQFKRDQLIAELEKELLKE
jgi:hypothetical protein